MPKVISNMKKKTKKNWIRVVFCIKKKKKNNFLQISQSEMILAQIFLVILKGQKFFDKKGVMIFFFLKSAVFAL